MEFYADASSLLIAIYEVLFIVFGFFDNFYAYHSLSKRIFFFKELEDNNFNIFKKNNQIKKLISTTSSFSPKFEEINKEETSDIEIYKDIQQKNDALINAKFSNKQLIPDIFEKEALEKTKNMITIKKKKKIIKKIRNAHNIFIKNDSHSKLESFKNANDIEKDNNLEENTFKIKEKMKYKFNIIEVIISQLFFCCMTKEFRLKTDLNQKANEILFRKLDIICYIRNMILFDIMNKTLLDNDKKAIINFLCRPIITKEKRGENSFEEFYKNYKEKDFDNLYQKLPEFVQNASKDNNSENRLISLSNEHLKDLI